MITIIVEQIYCLLHVTLNNIRTATEYFTHLHFRILLHICAINILSLSVLEEKKNIKNLLYLSGNSNRQGQSMINIYWIMDAVECCR